MLAKEKKSGFWHKPRQLLIAAIVVAVLLIAAGVMLYQLIWNKPLPVLAQIDHFSMENIDGTAFHSEQEQSKARLVAFIYTNCPDICPATTYYMAELQEELKEKGLFGNGVSFWSISFDPERDTPEVLANYANAHGADRSGWYFLRDEQEKVEEVAKRFGVGILERENGIYIHTMRTFLLDQQNNVRAIYGMAAEMDLEQILKDINKLVRE